MSPRIASGLRDSVVAVLRGSAILALVTYAAYRLHLNTAAAGFLYLIAVVFNCLDSSFIASTVVSILALACLDFFFIDPVLTWTVNSHIDIAALACFSVTSVVVTRLASRAREEAKTARLERQKLSRLYTAAQQLLTLKSLEGEQIRILTTLCQVFGLEAACVFDAATAELHATGVDISALGDRTREAYISGKDSDESAHRRSYRGLRVGGKIVGAIGFQGLNDVEIAGPIAALAAAALERARAVRRASDAAAEAQAERLRTAILDALAHEFKTPLATILTAAGGLREAGPLGREQAELAELVETEAERLSDLSSRLLRLARLVSEDVRPRVEPADLVSIVGGTIERYSRQYPERQFLFEKEGKSDQILADVNLLQLAIGQLVDNACRYSTAGSGVKVTVQFEDRSANVIVWNRGVGIAPQEGARVFERFYRGTDAQRVSSGSGLGLYVARKIAVAHGGALVLDDNHALDGGVAFRLTLPILAERT